MAEELENAEKIEPNDEKLQQEETLAEAPKMEVEAEEETPSAESDLKEEQTEEAPKQKRAPRKTTASAEEKPEEEEFNWDEIGKDPQIYSKEEKDRLEDIYSQTFNSIVEQDVVDGIIVAKTDREVVVNIGFKSDGIIPANELRHNPNLKIGDVVEVYVESQEDASGQLVLSHKKARLLKSWNRVNKAFEEGEIINGHIKSKTKGGLIVDIFGIEAFLPGSQIDVKPIRDYDIFVDKTMEFKVVKINHEFKNVVVSHKALIEIELEAQRAEIMSGLEKGQVLEGIVKNITNYGAFIDLGGVDGLIHITDLAWGRISHPEEVITLDQKINVVILDFDEEKKRIALGLKQLTPHPWDSLDVNLAVGDKISGKVVVIADYGAFIEVLPGVEGLIHVSEMSWSQHLRTAHDFLKVGDSVEAVVLTLDREDRKMSLGIKQLVPDPWNNIDKYTIGTKHVATVRNFTNFGIFVELEEGIDGLIHISDLSWAKKIKHPAEFTKIGETIDVVVLEMDVENRRLSLGHKQLEDNPWDVFDTIYSVGTIVEGTLTGQNDKGATVSLQGVEGFAFQKGLTREDNTTIKVGETAEFKVTEFSKENKKIVLSHSRIWQDKLDQAKELADAEAQKDEKETAKIAKRMSGSLERSTLGDLDALINLKADLETEEKTKKTAAKKKEEPKEEPKENTVEEVKAAETEEKPKAKKTTKAKKEETVADEAPAPKEEKPKKTRAKKEVEKEVAEPAAEAEAKPKKTRAKKATETTETTEESNTDSENKE